MKKAKLLFLVLFMLVFTACGEKPLQKEEVVVYHATDMHYLSQELTDNSPEFIQMIANGDGKMTHYIERITEAFVMDVIESKPDFLLIGGDITFNGEKLSHQDFALKLKRIEEAGTQVLVIPGNHDVDYPFCYKFEGPYYTKADRMTDEDFETLYADYGLKQAYSRDKNSFGYFYRLTDNITLLALDTNRGGGTGVAGSDTVAWIEKELAKMKEGTKLIVLTHQTLLNHFPSEDFSNQYSIINNGKLIELFSKYGITLNLSGHIHTQHAFTEDNITDIATESMAVMPYNYGVVTVNNEKITYNTQSVNVQKWAQETGQTDENLLNFDSYSKDFYMQSQINRTIDTIMDSGVLQEDRQLLAEFFAELNVYYFPGVVDQAYDYLVTTDGYEAWQNKGKDLWHYQYVMARMEEGAHGISHNKWEKIFN